MFRLEDFRFVYVSLQAITTNLPSFSMQNYDSARDDFGLPSKASAAIGLEASSSPRVVSSDTSLSGGSP